MEGEEIVDTSWGYDFKIVEMDLAIWMKFGCVWELLEVLKHDRRTFGWVHRAQMIWMKFVGGHKGRGLYGHR